MEWSLDKTKFFFADSLKYQLDVYDYDDSTGKICKLLIVAYLMSNLLDLI